MIIQTVFRAHCEVFSPLQTAKLSSVLFSSKTAEKL